MSRIFHKSGGFRRLRSFNYATIVHLGTISFCRRFLSRDTDPLGKTLGQMVGASRSGKQNIMEGSERARTSLETEMRLTDVAKGSLVELLGDFEDYLVGKGEVPWSIHREEHRQISALDLEPFEYTDDLLHDYWRYLLAEKRKFDPWLESQDDIVAANALIVLTQRAIGLLGKQLQQQEADFLAGGGVREKMTRARLEARQEQKEPPAEDVPACPDCGQPMRRRHTARGDFWGCGKYPDCRGRRPG